MVITFSKKRRINRIRLPILLVVSWTGKTNTSLSPFAPENSVSRDGFGSPVPPQPAHLHTKAESSASLRDPSRVPRRRSFLYLNRHTPSGQPRVYWVAQLRTDGIHCWESAATGIINLKVVPNECWLGRSLWIIWYAPFFPIPTIDMKWACWSSSMYCGRTSTQIENRQADDGPHLAKPNSQARTGTGGKTRFLVQLATSRIGSHSWLIHTMLKVQSTHTNRVGTSVTRITFSSINYHTWFLHCNLIFLKKILNASRSSEHPPVRGKSVKTFRYDRRLQRQNLFMAFKRVPRW